MCVLIHGADIFAFNDVDRAALLETYNLYQLSTAVHLERCTVSGWRLVIVIVIYSIRNRNKDGGKADSGYEFSEAIIEKTIRVDERAKVWIV